MKLVTYTLLLLLAAFFLLPFSAIKSILAQSVPSQTFDMANPGNWNLRIVGTEGNVTLFGVAYQNAFRDIDGNDLKDLVVCSHYESRGGRTDSGTCYLIFDSILNSFLGTGNTLDLADNQSYNIRFEGPVTGSILGYSVGASLADVNGNGKMDLLLPASGAHIRRPGAGAFYVILDDILDNFSGRGNVVDLALPENYSIRYDGAISVNDKNYISESFLIGADVDNNGIDDILVGSGHTGLEGRGRSGSLYLIYDSLINSYTGTGNTVDLEYPQNYNLVYYNAAGSYFSLLGDISAKDFNANGKTDIIIGAGWADNNSRQDSGSLYFLYDDLLDNYTGTGNRIDLTNPANFSLRLDGGATSDLLSYDSVVTKDLDGNGKLDLLTSSITDYNSRSDSGSTYILYDALLGSHTGPGDIIDLADSSNYNLRFDGAFANSGLGYGSRETADFDNDGLMDLILPASGDSNNLRNYSGSVYAISHALFSAYTGTGNTIDLADQSKYSLRYDGEAAEDYFGFSASTYDFNNDDSSDLMIESPWTDPLGRVDAGVLYFVYNFPHTISVTNERGGAKYVVDGIIDAANSTTNIAGVQYQLDGNNPQSGWSNCPATDGAFDSKNEAFSCTIKKIPQGHHTMYIRAVDTKGTLTPQSKYTTIPFSIGN